MGRPWSENLEEKEKEVTEYLEITDNKTILKMYTVTQTLMTDIDLDRFLVRTGS